MTDVGLLLGDVRDRLGGTEGTAVGNEVGNDVGTNVGKMLGIFVGPNDGGGESAADGANVRALLGALVGAAVGREEEAVGARVVVGTLVDGTEVGLRVGEGVLAKADGNDY